MTGPTIQDFFSNPRAHKGSVLKSTYIAGLRDARLATGRHLRSGKKLNKSHGSWLGAVGYMILVDLLAEIVANPLKPAKDEHPASFIHFLRAFCKLSYEDACTIYALRCSFMHDYGLVNNSKWKELNKRFVVTQGTGKLIFYSKGFDIYRVDLEEFGDMIEAFHADAKSGKLPLGMALANRHFIQYYPKLAAKGKAL